MGAPKGSGLMAGDCPRLGEICPGRMRSTSLSDQVLPTPRGCGGSVCVVSRWRRVPS